MTERIQKTLLFAIGIFVLCLSARAEVITIKVDSVSGNVQSLFPDKSKSLDNSHFTWGAEFGSSIDVTGHNHSTFNLNLNLGYKNALFKVFGIGVGINRSIASGDNYIPIYALVRTSFTRKPSLLFMNLQLGYSFNTIEDSPTFGDMSSALGLGINLSKSRKANSYLILSLGTRYFNQNHKSLIQLDTKFIYTANLHIGVNF